ncbi:hypothetical protein MTR67_006380 [Solanum verrucosum]|uniref:Uncharacterized protein n=1 Tax=Solanum verrucosum TaxID=315347 RepID=A0AAF0Q029_SOLVR|nr:hypothetical protein MTR67_006380 [Solanum verrucosum]
MFFLQQDLLSIANVAEQHKVKDFLSASSKLTWMMLWMILYVHFKTEICLNVEEIHKLALTQSNSESVNSFSDNDDGDKDGSRHGHEEVGPSSEDMGGIWTMS